MCLYLYLYCVVLGACGSQKNSLGLELREIVNHLVVLGTEARLSARTSAFTCSTILPASVLVFLSYVVYSDLAFSMTLNSDLPVPTVPVLFWHYMFAEKNLMFFKIQYFGLERWLRVLAALPEDPIEQIIKAQ